MNLTNIEKSIPVCFFPLFFLFMELTMRLMAKDIRFFDLDLFPIALFAIGFGFLMYVVTDIIPQRIVSRVVGGIIVVAAFIFYGIEFCCMDFYGMYFGLGYMFNMSGQVVTGFSDMLLDVVKSRVWKILILLMPVVLFFVFIKKIIPLSKRKLKFNAIVFGVSIALWISGSLIASVGEDKSIRTYDFEPNAAIQRYGMLNSFELETRYMIFGKPDIPLVERAEGEPLFTTFEPSYFPEETTVSTETSETATSGDATDVSDEPTPTPTPYPFNMEDIDFETLYNESDNNTIKSMHLYFGNLRPTQQNEYTGIFKDKNLILITAEAFSPYAVDKEYTPTLYKLSHESFIFTNFYQPNWHQSTTGGEYSVMVGQIPQWINGNNTFSASAHKYMYYGLGHVFGRMGYSTPAWHNGAYDYYNRDKTHPNLGYDFSAIGHGLDLPTNTWPASDMEMFEATVDSYIEDYVNNGTKFHAYYMTVSGHCNYSWGANAMSKRHKDSAVEAFPDASSPVQAYKAANKDLDLGLEYLINRLEEEGIAEDTVIIMAADHYPYGICKGDVDYYDEMSGIDDSEQDITRYRNTLVMWNGGMKKSLTINTPCSTIDIVPTILNLFGIEYDSRFFPGRDIFAPEYDIGTADNAMPLVILPMNAGNSWVTSAGQYDCRTHEFTPNPGVTVSDTYVDDVNEIVKDKWRYSGMIIQNDYFKYVYDAENDS